MCFNKNKSFCRRVSADIGRFAAFCWGILSTCLASFFVVAFSISGGLFNVRFVHFCHTSLLRNRYEGSPAYATPNFRQNFRPNFRRNFLQNVRRNSDKHSDKIPDGIPDKLYGEIYDQNVRLNSRLTFRQHFRPNL